MTSLAKVLRTVATNLGDAAVGSYSLAGAPTPIPTLVIPPSGFLPVVDCGDLLIVSPLLGQAVMQGPPAQCAIVMRANLSVTVTRCVANLTDIGTPASQTELTADALSLADDVSTIFYGLTGACRNGTLWKGFDGLGCADTTFGDWRPGASGGIGWFTLNIGLNISAALL